MNPPTDLYNKAGGNFEILRALSDDVRGVLLAQRGVSAVRADYEGERWKCCRNRQSGRPPYGIGPRRRRVSLQSALDGATGGTLIEAGEKFPVRVRFGDGLRADVTRIRDLSLALASGGDSDAPGQVVGNLLASLGLIVTLSVATVVLTFNSFRLSAIAFAVAILSAGISIQALAAFGYPFGITAIIGLIGSIGVAINAAIIILTRLQGSPAAMAGDRDAMAEVVIDSGRHIISTTLTTAGGGSGPPFAMSIAGGVFLSNVVGFFFTAQVFALTWPHRQVAVTSAQATAFPAIAAE